MKIVRKNGFRAALVAATAVGALLVAPAPASAVSSSCTITGTFISCNTGTIYSHATEHWVKMRVNRPYTGTTSCSLKDAVNGITVGSASVSNARPRGFFELITVNGLYGRYFAVCINTEHTGYGKIMNSWADV
jgi:hypothetical protein